ncbi:MAG: DUF4838 domain-containing protein [bacterium]
MRFANQCFLAGAVILIALACVTTEQSSIALTRNGVSDYVIVSSPDAIPAERHAAGELQQYIEKSAGVRLPIIEKWEGHNAIFVGPSEGLYRLAPDLSSMEFGNEEFLLETRAGNLIILGGRPRGTMYGVYVFLEDIVGCRWYTRDVEKVPQHKNLSIPKLHRRQAPAFEYREPFFYEGFDELWAARNRVNGFFSDLDESVGDKTYTPDLVHTFYPLVPPEKYFKDHPEYYSLVDGKRTAEYAQLCLSNPDVADIVIEEVFRMIKENPKATIFSVSQNDWEGYCQCEKCRAIDEREGSPSGSVITFCNKVAEAVSAKYPDKYIDTVAYVYTEKPPKYVRPHPNLIVRLCHIKPCCDSHPLASCPKNAEYVEHLRGWTEITEKVYIWHYVTDFCHFFMPFPDFDALRQDIPLYHRFGVQGIFCQGNQTEGGGGDMTDLRCYLIAKLLWDPAIDFDATMNEFLQCVYGSAWKPLREYIDLLQDYVRLCDIHIDLYSPPEIGHLTPEMRRRIRNLFEEALYLADNQAIRDRVEKAMLAIDYTDLYFQQREMELAGEDKIDPDLAEHFIHTVRKNGMTYVNETNEMEDYFQSLRCNGPFVTNWWIVGPFPRGEETQFGPEKRIAFDETFDGFEGKTIAWQKVLGRAGYLDFTKHLYPHHIVGSAYAFTWLDSDREHDLTLSIGSNDGVVLYLNGEMVHRNLAPHKSHPDLDRVPVHLRAGRNELLAKVIQLGLGWGLYVRLMTKEGDLRPTLGNSIQQERTAP